MRLHNSGAVPATVYHTLIADHLKPLSRASRDGKASASGSQETCHASKMFQSFRVKGNGVDGLPFYFNYFFQGS